MQNMVLVQLLLPFRKTIKVQRVQNSEGLPNLKSIWRELRQEFFPELQHIDNYEIVWSSRRQKRTLASCNITKQRVVVANELQHPQHHRWLRPLIYHEMCHAALGKEPGRGATGKRLWHGRAFKNLAARMPETRELDLWVVSGGWRKAVRSARARQTFARFRKLNK